MCIRDSLSEAMLRMARDKSAAAGLHVDFYRMDLRELRLPEQYDLALLFQDGLNYLLAEEELLQAFSGVRELLRPGGLFIFDLTRPSLRTQSEQFSVCWADEPEFPLIWESRYDCLLYTSRRSAPPKLRWSCLLGTEYPKALGRKHSENRC